MSLNGSIEIWFYILAKNIKSLKLVVKSVMLSKENLKNVVIIYIKELIFISSF